MKKNQNIILFTFVIAVVFAISFLFATNKLNKDILETTKNVAVEAEKNLNLNTKLYFFGLEVITYNVTQGNSGEHYLDIIKSDIYNYIPFIFAAIATLVISTSTCIVYFLLYRSKRRMY